VELPKGHSIGRPDYWYDEVSASVAALGINGKSEVYRLRVEAMRNPAPLDDGPHHGWESPGRKSDGPTNEVGKRQLEGTSACSSSFPVAVLLGSELSVQGPSLTPEQGHVHVAERCGRGDG
jgi:hypothetical protein